MPMSIKHDTHHWLQAMTTLDISFCALGLLLLFNTLGEEDSGLSWVEGMGGTMFGMPDMMGRPAGREYGGS
jgi:hypothetical protein